MTLQIMSYISSLIKEVKERKYIERNLNYERDRNKFLILEAFEDEAIRDLEECDELLKYRGKEFVQVGTSVSLGLRRNIAKFVLKESRKILRKEPVNLIQVLQKSPNTEKPKIMPWTKCEEYKGDLWIGKDSKYVVIETDENNYVDKNGKDNNYEDFKNNDFFVYEPTEDLLLNNRSNNKEIKKRFGEYKERLKSGRAEGLARFIRSNWGMILSIGASLGFATTVFDDWLIGTAGLIGSIGVALGSRLNYERRKSIEEELFSELEEVEETKEFINGLEDVAGYIPGKGYKAY